MSYSQINQLYTDIAQQAKKQPDQLVPPFTVAIYNTVLAEAQKSFSDNAILHALPEIAQRVSYGDFLAPIGQLKQLLYDAEWSETFSNMPARQRSEFEKGMDNW